MPDSTRPINEDLVVGIGPVTAEIYGQDTKKYRRKVYGQFERDPEKRLKGLLKMSDRGIALIRSVFREDLRRRAGAPDV
jgi:hypothetical protein